MMDKKRTVYDKYLGEYMHEHGRHYELMEAVISVRKYVIVLDGVLQDNKEKIISFYDIYSDEDYDVETKNALDFFNNIFKLYKIKFELSKKPSTSSGILSGKTYYEDITIYFGFDFINYLYKENFNEFRIKLLTLFGHELIHRGQYYLRTADFINFYAYESEEKDSSEYYKRPSEVMAYAWMGLENMRFNGLSDERILQKIKKGDILYAEIGAAFLYIDKMKQLDISTYKRFIKYIYDYLKNPIKHELKILV